MSFTLTTSGAAMAKAGKKANTFDISGATLYKWSDEVEGTICARSRYDWVTNITLVGTVFKGALSDLASDLIAMKIVNYDMSGFTSRLEAQTVLDVLRDNAVKNLEILNDDKYQEVMI